MKAFCKFLIAIILATLSQTAQSQVYQTRNYIKIPQGVKVTKSEKVINCDEPVKKGYSVISEYKKKNGDVDYTINKRYTPKSDTVFRFDKEVKIIFDSLEGRANLSVNEKDNSILNVNYWLNPKTVIEGENSIRITKFKLNCNGKPELEIQGSIRKLTKDTTVYLWEAHKKDTNEKWFEYSDVVIEVYKAGIIDHYLVNKYDVDGNYSIQLTNREFISYKNSAVEFGALTIPLKYRFGYTEEVNGQKIKVNEEFISDLNLAVFMGYKIAKYRVRYEGGKLRDLSNLGCTVGGFLSLSSATIDTLATTTAEIPLGKDVKASIAVISPGFGAMFTFYNFQLGGFVGWDFGAGENGKKWNAHGKPWIGLGLGYSLSSFWKK